MVRVELLRVKTVYELLNHSTKTLVSTVLSSKFKVVGSRLGSSISMVSFICMDGSALKLWIKPDMVEHMPNYFDLVCVFSSIQAIVMFQQL